MKPPVLVSVERLGAGREGSTLGAGAGSTLGAGAGSAEVAAGAEAGAAAGAGAGAGAEPQNLGVKHEGREGKVEGLTKRIGR